MNELINTLNQRKKYYLVIYLVALLLDLLVFRIRDWTCMVPFKVVPLVVMVISGNFIYHRTHNTPREECIRCIFKSMGIVISILTAFILLAVLFWTNAGIDLGPIIFY